MAKNTTIRPKGCMTPNEVGQLLGITGDKVKYWIKHGKLKARKAQGGFYWVRMADAIKAFADLNTGKASPLVHIEGQGSGGFKVIDCSGNGKGR